MTPPVDSQARRRPVWEPYRKWPVFNRFNKTGIGKSIMGRQIVCLIAAACCACAGTAIGQAKQPPASQVQLKTLPPAPAFTEGMMVVDRSGAQIGRVKSLVETQYGALIIVEIDGKLVGVPRSTLLLQNEKILSSQTKDEILRAAGAPR